MRNVSGIGDLSCLFSKCQVLGTHEVSKGKIYSSLLDIQGWSPGEKFGLETHIESC